MVERARLENENSRKAIEGSNPSLSAEPKRPDHYDLVFLLLRGEALTRLAYDQLAINDALEGKRFAALN